MCACYFLYFHPSKQNSLKTMVMVCINYVVNINAVCNNADKVLLESNSVYNRQCMMSSVTVVEIKHLMQIIWMLCFLNSCLSVFSFLYSSLLCVTISVHVIVFYGNVYCLASVKVFVYCLFFYKTRLVDTH